METNIPVLTFHTVIDHIDSRPWSFLSVSVKVFENTLKYLKKHHYETITLKELYDIKKNNVRDGVKRVLIHFDDGFLDNYTITYPMLKKYGFRATVFISPEFVDPRGIKRELQYERIMRGEKPPLENSWGYMSWEELKEIDQSGVIDVQAHAMTHTWYPCSDKLVDYHKRGDSFYWLYWNSFTEKKPFWLTEYDETAIPYGYPVFQYAKSLSGKRFIPDDDVIRFCVQYFSGHGGEEKEQYLSGLREALHKEKGDILGHYETEAEFTDRIKEELYQSKLIDEEKLGKKIEFLAWPGGAISQYAIDTAESSGYLAYTKKGKPYNENSDELKNIFRIGGWSGIKFGNAPSPLFEKFFLKMQLHRSLGDKSFINRMYAKAGTLYRKRNINKAKESGESWK